MTIHRYIFPMKIISVEARDEGSSDVKLDIGGGISVTFHLPSSQANDKNKYRFIVEVNDAQS